MRTNQERKIEPFYCKPASHDEEIEIAKRLLDNGVCYEPWPSVDERLLKVESVTEWGYIGVNYDGVLTRWVDYPVGIEKLTIHQIRERYPFPDEVTQEFVPEVGGDAFEWSDNGLNFSVGVLIFNDGVSVLIEDKNHPYCRRLFNSGDRELIFRPLKTEAEINTEKQVKEIWNDLEEFYAEANCPQPYDTAKHMHDKGYIKPREITSELINELMPPIVDKKYEIGFIEGARWAESHILGKDQ